MSAGEPLLKIRGLVVEGRSGRKWRRIVDGVDLDLRKGEVLGLVGESGAGKSTLGLAAMGFTRDGRRIARGTVEFDGTDLVKAPAAKRRALLGRRIAYVPQSAASGFNPAHRIIDQHIEAPVGHGLMTEEESRKDAVELYRRLYLPDPEEIGERYPQQLSQGELQRAMTAMAMACRPDLIIFDEPTSSLDVTTQIEVLAAIREAVDRLGTAAIYITHDLAVVAQMADRIKVLLKGAEVEEAETREILGRPQEEYTRTLWAVRRHERAQMPMPGESETPVIQIDGVGAAYGEATALTDVGFSIHRARTVAVVGESGAGKSTVARCITGLLPPTEGMIKHNGVLLPPDYRFRTKDQLRLVQMIHEAAYTALNPRKRIGDIIGRPVKFYTGLGGARLRTRVEELMQMVELDPDEFYDRLPSEISGGEIQRVSVARALAAEPELIVCDEIASGLDQLAADGVLMLLDRLQKELNLAYVYISHDLSIAKAVADWVVVMRNGAVVESGPKDEVFRPPHHPYTDLLLSSTPEMDPFWLTRFLERRRRGDVVEAASS